MRRNISIILLFIGILVLMYPYIARWVNTLETQTVEKDFQETIIESKKNTDLKEMKKCNKELASTMLEFNDPFQEIKGNLQKQHCSSDIFVKDEVIGILKIPTLQLIEPIYEGSTENELGKGVGLLEGSSIPVGGLGTHAVLAGHRGLVSRAMFKNLDKLKEGDSIFITSAAGTLEYKILQIRTVLPYETEFLKINKEKDLVTLFTCTPFPSSTHRLMLHAERVNNS